MFFDICCLSQGLFFFGTFEGKFWQNTLKLFESWNKDKKCYPMLLSLTFTLVAKKMHERFIINWCYYLHTCDNYPMSNVCTREEINLPWNVCNEKKYQEKYFVWPKVPWLGGSTLYDCLILVSLMLCSLENYRLCTVKLYRYLLRAVRDFIERT